MDGVAGIRALLVGASPVTTLVPAARIVTGVLPQGTGLPAITIASISRIALNLPAPGTVRQISERVQVTVSAATYVSQKAILRAVVAACDATFPAVDGITVVTVHLDGAGPDFMNETASIYLGSQDLRVIYNEPR